MELQTLVLDRSYQPIRRVPWTEAISLWWSGRAEVLEEYDEVARSPSREVHVPAVVRHVRGMHRRRTGEARFNRRTVYLRDGGRCQYCGAKVPLDAATYDHLVPRCQGGETVWENILLSCVPCNQKKGGRTAAEARMAPRSMPRRPRAGTLPLVPHVGTADVPEVWKTYLGKGTWA